MAANVQTLVFRFQTLNLKPQTSNPKFQKKTKINPNGKKGIGFGLIRVRIGSVPVRIVPASGRFGFGSGLFRIV